MKAFFSENKLKTAHRLNEVDLLQLEIPGFDGHVSIIPHYQVKHSDEMLWKRAGNLLSPLLHNQEKTTLRATER